MPSVSSAGDGPVVHRSGPLGRLRIVGAVFAWVAAVLTVIANEAIVSHAVRTGAASGHEDVQLVVSHIDLLLSALDWDVLCVGCAFAFLGVGLLLSFRFVFTRAIGLAYVVIGLTSAAAGACSLAHYLPYIVAPTVVKWSWRAAIGIPAVMLVGLLIPALRQRLVTR